MRFAKPSKMENQSNLPPLLNQIANLAIAGRDTVLEFLKSGKVKASSQMHKDRMEICLACDKLTDDFRCSQCGCYIRAKSQLLSQDCPLRKWPHKEY
jgi:Family of unknown function (DUF6171)